MTHTFSIDMTLQPFTSLALNLFFLIMLSLLDSSTWIIRFLCLQIVFHSYFQALLCITNVLNFVKLSRQFYEDSSALAVQNLLLRSTLLLQDTFGCNGGTAGLGGVGNFYQKKDLRRSLAAVYSLMASARQSQWLRERKNTSPCHPSGSAKGFAMQRMPDLETDELFTRPNRVSSQTEHCLGMERNRGSHWKNFKKFYS